MNAVRRRNTAIDKLEEFRVIILEHILKTVLLSKHEAVAHWKKEILSYQTRLIRYHKGKGGKANFTKAILWEYLWEDQIDELPLGFIEDYKVKNVQLNIDEVKRKLTIFIDGILKSG